MSLYFVCLFHISFLGLNTGFLENSLEIKQFIKKDATEIQKNFWLEFFETKSFNMQVNTHIIKYVFHNKKNVNKVYRYINFRFFFEQVSLKKIETDYPPYLLIEPVSTCNLRCPFCFQTDKTFTKKSKSIKYSKYSSTS